MGSFTIAEAKTAAEIVAAGALFREYAAGLPFSLCFQGFDRELETLPGRYAPPSGALLLAWRGGEAAGCVALREIDADADGRVCEMKRLYVRPGVRGLGIGRALCERLIGRAAAAGYVRMKLDTSGDMAAAHALYRALGFTPCARYNDDPLEDTLYFSLTLLAQAVRTADED